jgi:hypothetical protein
MYKNTALLIAFLAVIAGILVGYRMGVKTRPTEIAVESILYPSASPIPTPTSASVINYTSPDCRINLSYSSDFDISEASSSAVFINKSNETDTIRLICGIEFPKPPLAKDRINEATVGGQLATVYHDASAKDGTPLDVYVMIHPLHQFEIALFGYGAHFEAVLQTLKYVE